MTQTAQKFRQKSRRFGAPWRILAGICGIATAAYLVLQFAPGPIVWLIPSSWKNTVGEKAETVLAGGRPSCGSPSGTAAFNAMLARLADGNPNLPGVALHVYDIGVMNAFSLPGNRIIVTKKLIDTAGNATELAGVLAHEMGHIVYHHSEQQFVRTEGLELLLSFLTGGHGVSTAGSIANAASLMRYSREAEREADNFAVQTLADAEIDPMGLRHFFERMLEAEEKHGTVGKVLEAFDSHPATEDRIAAIHPLPDPSKARPVLNDAQWLAIKTICD